MWGHGDPICTAVATGCSPDCARVPITVVFNGVLTGSGCLIFRSPPLLNTQNRSKRLPFGSVQLNLGLLSCNRSAVWYSQTTRGKVKEVPPTLCQSGQYPGEILKHRLAVIPQHRTWEQNRRPFSLQIYHQRGQGHGEANINVYNYQLIHKLLVSF